MMRRVRSRSRLTGVLVAIAVALSLIAIGGPRGSPSDASALSKWTGGIDLYRSGVFTTQQSWLWCTAAGVQIIRNIVDRQSDHSTTSQSRYFAYMRNHNRYPIPTSDGVDPAGWTSGLQRYVDGRYRLFQHASFDRALRDAVTNLRKTSLPVAVAVQQGNHGWVLTGFTATADPATTSTFTVTSVRVTGPLWGLQNSSYGYDMKPDTRLTPAQFRTFFTSWHYARIKMVYEGRWISIQGVATAPKPKPATTAAPTAKPSVAPSASPVASPSAAPSASGLESPQPLPAASVETAPASAVPASPPSSTASLALPGVAAIVGVIAAVAVALTIALRARAGPQRRG